MERICPGSHSSKAARPAWIQASLTTKPTFLNTRHLYLRLNKHNRRRGPGGLSDYLPEILRTSPAEVLSLSWLFLRLMYPRVLASFWDALSGAHGDETLIGASWKCSPVRGVSGWLHGHQLTNSNLRPTSEEKVKFIQSANVYWTSATTQKCSTNSDTWQWTRQTRSVFSWNLRQTKNKQETKC